MSIYKIKRFSSNQLDFSEVISFLKEYKDIPFETLYRNNAYGTGLCILKGFELKDKEEFEKVINILIEKFKYQFCFGKINNKPIFSFKKQQFFKTLKNGDIVSHILLQPTIKIKADKLTQYVPNKTLFHFTDVKNLNSIMKNGLIPKGRSGNSVTGYNYPPCIHFMTDLSILFNYENGKIIPVDGWRTKDLIMFEITPPKSCSFVMDPAFELGVICYDPIPKSCIRLVDPSEYKDLFLNRSIKEFDKTVKIIKINEIPIKFLL
jgi:hypothetical protein